MNTFKVLFFILFSNFQGYGCKNKNLNDCKVLCDYMLGDDYMLGGDLNKCVDKCVDCGSNLRNDLDACEMGNEKKCQIICQESEKCLGGCFKQYCGYIYYDVMFLLTTESC